MVISESPAKPLFEVPSRFHRSVNIVGDFDDPESLDGYILTPTARSLASRIINERLQPRGSRAWSILGPYGTGKSSFALFLQKYLSGNYDDIGMISELREDLDDSSKLLPVPIVGSRRDFRPVLHDAIARASRGLGGTLVDLDPEDMGKSLEMLSDQACRSGYDGIAVIADEFGKFLEHAASEADSDLYDLQVIAEQAQRSEGRISIVNLLHMSYTEYLSGLDRKQQSEWQKVQGRFTEVSFREPNEQFLRLISSAITPSEENSDAEGMSDRTAAIVAKSEFDEARRKMDLSSILSGCVPLHPISALMAWPIFRSSLAQNERSLFSFLTSEEPFGFRDFLSKQESGSISWFGLHDFYDYIQENFGVSAFSGAKARRWQEIENGLGRLMGDSPQMAEKIVKSIGLLSIFGPSCSMRASEGVLGLLFDNDKLVGEAMEYLTKNSIIINRRHEGSFALWEGSDLDLEEIFDASSLEAPQLGLSEALSQCVEPQTRMARRYYIEKGSIRTFDVSMVNGSDFTESPGAHQARQNSPGQILHVLKDGFSSQEELVDHCREVSSKKRKGGPSTIVALAIDSEAHSSLVREWVVWKWISANVAQLKSDRIARSEVESRIRTLESRVQRFYSPIVGGKGQSLDVNRSRWYSDGVEVQVESSSDLQRILSSVCYEVFPRSPTFHNELINRDHPSTSGSKAIRNLIEAMLHNPEDPRLGIVRYPPEITILEGMLRKSGIHRVKDGIGSFQEPEGEWKEVWDYVLDFLGRKGRVGLEELYEFLESPPIGLKRGVMPILLCSFHCVLREEVAFYEEEGRAYLYNPVPDIEMFERMYRRPELFEIQLYRLTPSFNKALKKLYGAITSSKSSKTPKLLEVVKPLVVFAAQLPPYSRKTRSLEPPHVVEVRDAILNATDPFDLTFVELPGLLDVDIESDPSGISNYVKLLSESVSSMRQAYPSLLARIEQEIRSEMRLVGDSSDAKSQLSSMGSSVVGLSSDPVIGPLSRELSNIRDRDWRELIGRVVNKGIPPSEWTDRQVSEFSLRLKGAAVSMRHHLEIAAERGVEGSGVVASFGLLYDGSAETGREVVRVSDDESEALERFSEGLRAVIPEGATEDERRVLFAAFVKVIQENLMGESDD